MNDVQVALVQLASTPGDVSWNLDRHAAFARDAAGRGAGIVCFPELSVTGYGRSSEMRILAEPVPGPSSRRLEQISRDTGVTILAGLLERAGASILNTHVVVGPDGLVGKYSKTHVAGLERPAFDPGDALPLFDHARIRFGIQICYDVHFPELSAAMADGGAEVLFVPHASAGQESRADKTERWMRYLPARAYDNTVYVAVCNASGRSADGEAIPGIATVLDPLGRVVAASDEPGECMLVARLTAAVLDEVRARPGDHFRTQRRQGLAAAAAPRMLRGTCADELVAEGAR